MSQGTGVDTPSMETWDGGKVWKEKGVTDWVDRSALVGSNDMRSEGREGFEGLTLGRSGYSMPVILAWSAA